MCWNGIIKMRVGAGLLAASLMAGSLFPAQLSAAEPGENTIAPLRSVGEIRALSAEDSTRRRPVSLEAIVTYNDPDEAAAVGALQASTMSIVEIGKFGLEPESARRKVADSRVLAGLPFWTAQPATLVLVALALAVGAAVGWGWSLRRKLREHTGVIRSRLEREETFSEFGGQLSAASSRKEVGRVIVDAAQRLLGWDSCFLNLYDQERGEIEELIVFETDAGKIKEQDVTRYDKAISDFKRSVLNEKGQLVLRPRDLKSSHGLMPFGLEDRLSASLMFVPCRSQGKPVGILSIQSYTHDAYTAEDLKLLQALADHSAGALTRVRAQEALRASEIRFRTVTDGLGEGITITDLENRVLYANSRMTELTGFDLKDLIGRPAYELLQPEDSWDLARHRNSDCMAGVSERYETRLCRKDGSEFWSEVYAAPFRNPDGEIVGTLGCMVNIDERKQTLEDLRQSEQRFSTTFHASPVPLCSISLEDGKFVDANRTFFSVSEYRRDEVVGHSAQDLGLWESSQEHARFIAMVNRHGVVRDLECALLTKHGERREYLLSAETIELSSSSGLLVSCFDITERLSLEERLRHSQKMEAVGQLAAGVAHDFNNILTIVKGHVSLLAEDEGLDSVKRESLEHITRASDRAAELTRQLLAFSRKQVMTLSRIDLNQELDTIASMLKSLLVEGIELRCEFCDGPAPIFADTGMIGQIVTNLAMNARDAMPRGGALTLETRLQPADDSAGAVGANGFVRLRISDTGEGIDPVSLPRIFEPFFSTKEVGKGTGLGLATVYGLVNQHKGRISVDSKLGEGTTFTVHFPLEPGPTDEAVKSPEKAVDVVRNSDVVLVVEDEPALRDLVATVLKRYGYSVLVASDGQEALDLWRRESDAVRLLLTDVVMPGGISGFELAEELLGMAPGLPVIYTSGYSVGINNKGIQLTEGYDFLPKPYRPDMLAEIVRRRLPPESAECDA
ncbi:MAG: two-component system cell cycle sensor histidine kinase/response regulator CckA [Candidatus Binatia bacterium]|jgi:two-component system cell cycle sensor histidine kinase/response regulator CckA